jgi:hypothetical protein
VQRRRQTGIDLLDGGDRPLLLRIRAHGNLSETAPIALLLLVVLELQSADGLVVAGLGGMLLAGRILHAWALIWADSKPARIVGMMLTTAATSFGAVINLWLALSR